MSAPVSGLVGLMAALSVLTALAPAGREGGVGSLALGSAAVLACGGALALAVLERRSARRRSQPRHGREVDRFDPHMAVSSAAPVGLALLDTDLRFLCVNPHLAALNGLAVEAHLGRTLREVLPDIADELEPLYRAVLGTGKPRSAEIRGVGPALPNVERITRLELTPVRDATGRLRGVHATVRETTEERARTRGAEASEDQLRLASEAARLATYELGVVSRTLYGSRELARILGAETPLERAEARIAELLHPEDRERFGLAVRRSLEPDGEGRLCEEVRTVGTDGSPRWILVRGETLFDGSPSRRAVRAVGAVVDISERKQAELEVARSEEHLRRVLDSLFAFVGVLTPEGILLEANRAPLAAAGLTLDEVRGRRFEETWWWSYAPEAQAQLRAAIEAAARGESPRYDVRVRIRDGAFLTVDFMISPLRDESGRITHLVPSAVDVTARVAVEEALRRKTRELEQEEERKNLFLATLGHELRNPLAALQNAIRLLERGHGEPRRIQQMIADHVRQLTMLVNDLLQVSRITRGMLDLKPTRVDLAAVVRRAIDAARGTIETRGQRLSLAAPAALAIQGDAVRLEQIASNLLTNAVKFTPPGGSIRVELERAGSEAVLRVADSGRGMSEETLAGLFKPFSQAEPGDGLGIGLALTRGLVELHGGTIRATSRGLDLGSTFEVRIPLGEPGRPRASLARPADTAAVRALPSGLRVLVVDDERDSADSLALLLRLDGCHATVAYSGGEAVEAAARERLHAVLLDIRLPDESGYDVIRRLRRLPGLEDALILAVTGFGDERAERAIARSGFDGRLVKPVDHDALRARLRERAERGL